LDDRELGQRIAYWRRRRGLTQKIFADRLGRSKSWVVKIESGARSAGRLATLDLICEVLRIDLAALIGEEPKRRGAICLADTQVERIQAALERYPLQPRADRAIDVEAVRRQLEHAWTAFEFADYDIVSLVIPALIEDAQAVHEELETEQSARQLTEAYQLAASTLRKLGEHSLAWLAGDRGMALAQRNGDLTSVVATGFRIANALLSMGRSQQAQSLSVSLAERLQSEARNEADRALYGHVLMQAAVAAATAGDAAAVRDLTHEATETARFVAPNNNHYRLAFNATNVLLHQVGALLALGEGGRAIEVAGQIDEDNLRILRRERRAALLVDIARAHSQVGNRDEAVRRLIEAEAVAAREVQCRPLAQATIADLLRRCRNAPPLGLAQLAERSGVRI
jgi:transcriptional regulator with XRE-family HTH domain